jgi:hypothetical protein
MPVKAGITGQNRSITATSQGRQTIAKATGITTTTNAIIGKPEEADGIVATASPRSSPMRYICLIVVLVVGVASCNASGERATITFDVNPFGWESGRPVVLHYENEDTISLRTISLIIHSQRGVGGRVEVGIKTVNPDALSFTETLSLDMATEITPYRSNVILNRKGEYVFSVSPMAGEVVKGVFSIGIIIE